MTLLALGLLTVIVAGIAFSRMIFGPSAGAPQTTSLAQDQAEQSEKIAALGRIEPWSEIINLGAGAGPDRLESLFVERGDLVKRGEVIGYVGGYAEQIAQRDLLRAQLDEAKARMKAETALNLLRIKAAELSRRRVIELSPYRIAAQDATVGSLEARKAHEKESRRRVSIFPSLSSNSRSTRLTPRRRSIWLGPPSIACRRSSRSHRWSVRSLWPKRVPSG